MLQFQIYKQKAIVKIFNNNLVFTNASKVNNWDISKDKRYISKKP